MLLHRRFGHLRIVLAPQADDILNSLLGMSANDPKCPYIEVLSPRPGIETVAKLEDPLPPLRKDVLELMGNGAQPEASADLWEKNSVTLFDELSGCLPIARESFPDQLDARGLTLTHRLRLSFIPKFWESED
jgi:hypothetical protein